MQAIELDQEFFDSVKNEKREDIVNGIVNNVMSGQYEYHGVGEHWNLQDFVNEALGDGDVCKKIAEATIFSKSYLFCQSAIFSVENVAYENLESYVQSFCNQHDIGIA